MKIAFLGDSITFGYALDNRRERYSTVLCSTLGAEEMNFGITGTLMARAGLSASDGTSFLVRWENLRGGDYAVVFGGTNDYFWSDRPIEGEEERYFRCAVRILARNLLTLYPAERVLFLTPYSHHGIGNYQGGEAWNTSSEHDTTAVNYVGHSLGDYAKVIAEETVALNIPCLDLHSIPFDWRKRTVDGCHPDTSGHRWIAERILEYFNFR